MQLVSCHNGQLQMLSAIASEGAIERRRKKAFVTGLEALDTLAPDGAFVRGAIHEILSDPNECTPLLLAMIIARAASGCLVTRAFQPVRATRSVGQLDLPRSASTSHGLESPCHEATFPPLSAIIWCDPHHQLYPPALAAAGIALDRLYLLQPKTPADETWAIAQCLRCKGVGATVAGPPRLGRLESRRLQLAAEAGGGVGILLRNVADAQHYAAATRWLVAPCPGERTVQKWKIQLIHGHGGRVGQTVILENHRETHSLRATAQLADRSTATRTATPATRRRASA